MKATSWKAMGCDPRTGRWRLLPAGLLLQTFDPKQDEEVSFTDDLIWAKDKSGLFRLVVLLQNVQDLKSSLAAVQDIDRASGGHIQQNGITIIREDLSASASPVVLESKKRWQRSIYRVASGEEFSRSRLCHHRPEPKGYDPYRLSKEVQKKRFIFLRPDRFVFAACDSKEEVDRAAARIAEFLEG
ncbi:hypothetical protein VTN77DRAFT_9687 [Rasamsonia byssochlamydoides]|uniref:uncharacterized protein n=1 Tax=Rasamsonia byssochlamydoides TaxID=89139 RepID=UPI003742DFE3